MVDSQQAGQVAKGFYEVASDNLDKAQTKNITESTQTMLRIGMEFKNNLEIDSPEKRKALLAVTFSLLGSIKEIALEKELSDLVG